MTFIFAISLKINKRIRAVVSKNCLHYFLKIEGEKNLLFSLWLTVAAFNDASKTVVIASGSVWSTTGHSFPLQVHHRSPDVIRTKLNAINFLIVNSSYAYLELFHSKDGVQPRVGGIADNQWKSGEQNGNYREAQRDRKIRYPTEDFFVRAHS